MKFFFINLFICFGFLSVFSLEFTSDANTAALWHFNEGGGEILTDASGNGDDGLVVRATWTSGFESGGLLFDGGSQFVVFGDAASLDGSSEITVEAWFKLNEHPTGANFSTILAKGDYSGPAGDAFFMRFRENDGVSYMVSNGTTGSFFNSGEFPTLDVWHYAAMTWKSGEKIKGYLDGKEIGEGDVSINGLVNNVDEGIKIAAADYSGASTFLNGKIDEIRISNSARDSSEIVAHWEANKEKPTPVAHRDFNTGIGNTWVVFPNPFRNRIEVNYALPSPKLASVLVYGVNGKQIREYRKDFAFRQNKVSWDGRDHSGKLMPNGVYLIQLKAGDLVVSKKVLKTN